ncbi:MAG: 4-hydroxythreonine-4-phosphate dehydrogenase PdxA, partial [Dehalococcoidales bacterium]|nr:4-hydroxythreonine-4-phosphate dehydrogenase PdxA [Dehalococcoidales bacterium]
MPVEERPIIAITMGDAAGIGPEVIIKALSSKSIIELCCPLLVGSASVMSEQIKSLGSSLKLNPVDRGDEARGRFGTIDIIDLRNLEREEVVTGTICRACGRAAMEYIETASGMMLRGEARAVVTAPINKEATKQAGYEDIGHLEYMARLTGSTEYATMLVSGPLRVVHLTTHHSLREACSLVTRERILARLRLIQDTFK